MKTTILLAFAVICIGCTTRPKAKFIDPVTGAVTEIDLGGTFAAEADGVIASVEYGKAKFKYSSIKENSAEVPKQLIQTTGVVAGGIILNKGEAIREGTNQVVAREGTKVELGKQATQRHAAEQGTKQFIHGTPNPNIK